jgi:phenylpyruvate tautomerase PptA (4-oxalocrotonate tautomerase family)
MPVIEMYVQEGTLDEDTKNTLHDRVSRQVLEAEGATYEESARAKAITWMMIHEIPAGSWSVGSEILSADEPRVLTRVSVLHGSMDDERRADITARVNREVVSALGEELTDPTKSFCLISEETFSGGGIVVNFPDLMRWLGLEHVLEEREEKEASEPVAAGSPA